MELGFSYGLAVVLRVITLAMAALGVVVQRKSHVNNDAKVKFKQKNALRRPLWHLGFWLYVLSSVISDLVGISSLPLLVIALMGTLLLFFNAIYSHFILQESMTKVGWVGTLVVAGSSTGLAVLLNLQTAPKSVDELNDLVGRTVYIIYCSLTFALLVAIAIANWICLQKRNRYLEVSESTDIGVATTALPLLNRFNFWVALLYASLSTILGSVALVFAKISFELLQSSIATEHNQFKSPVSICFLIVTIVTTILQLIFFNFSLHYYPTLFTIPFGYSVGIILACLNTLVYYDSFFVLDAWKSVLVVCCVLFTIFGIYLLSR